MRSGADRSGRILRPSDAFGEMPLDLAGKKDVQGMLLSAVWSTSPDAVADSATNSDGGRSRASAGNQSAIDDDNPSSHSEVEGEVAAPAVRRRKSRRSKGKRRVSRASSFGVQSASVHSPSQRSASILSEDTTPHATPAISPSLRTIRRRTSHAASETRSTGFVDVQDWSHIPGSSFAPPPFKLPDGVWERLPLSSFWPTASDDGKVERPTDAAAQHGWVAFPAPSWETLTKMTSPKKSSS